VTHEGDFHIAFGTRKKTKRRSWINAISIQDITLEAEDLISYRKNKKDEKCIKISL